MATSSSQRLLCTRSQSDKDVVSSLFYKLFERNSFERAIAGHHDETLDSGKRNESQQLRIAVNDISCLLSFREQLNARRKRDGARFKKLRGGIGLMFCGKHVTEKRRILQGETHEDGSCSLQANFERSVAVAQGAGKHSPKLCIPVNRESIEQELLRLEVAARRCVTDFEDSADLPQRHVANPIPFQRNPGLL